MLIFIANYFDLMRLFVFVIASFNRFNRFLVIEGKYMLTAKFYESIQAILNAIKYDDNLMSKFCIIL